MQPKIPQLNRFLRLINSTISSLFPAGVYMLKLKRQSFIPNNRVAILARIDIETVWLTELMSYRNKELVELVNCFWKGSIAKDNQRLIVGDFFTVHFSQKLYGHFVYDNGYKKVTGDIIDYLKMRNRFKSEIGAIHYLYDRYLRKQKPKCIGVNGYAEREY